MQFLQIFKKQTGSLSILALGTLLSIACSSCTSPREVTSKAGSSYSGPTDKFGMPVTIPKSGRLKIRTTAYTHTEADSLQYGLKTASGTNLKYSRVRSAAADWSRFPYGTIFKIAGDKSVYQIDDYGSALVGTSTIDLYKPSKSSMNDWGVRKVDIQIVKWGSFEKSLDIMKVRTRASHVSKMVAAINSKLRRRG